MDSSKEIEILQSSYLFQSLDTEKIKEIIALMQEEIVPANTTFIEEHTPGEKMYIMLSGLARVYTLTEEGKEITVTMRVPGDVIGEMAVLDDKPRSANVVTLQDSLLLSLRKKDFLELINKNPSIAMNIIRVLSLRIRENVAHIENTSTQDLSERTYQVLHTLSYYFDNNDIELSHEEIATIVGATRPRVTEALHVLEDQGKITIAAKKIHVR